jgi:hypothetical protein
MQPCWLSPTFQKNIMLPSSRGSMLVTTYLPTACPKQKSMIQNFLILDETHVYKGTTKTNCTKMHSLSICAGIRRSKVTTQQNKIHYGRHHRNYCTLTISYLLRNAVLMPSAPLQFEQSGIRCWWRCWQSHLVSGNGPDVLILRQSVPHSNKEHENGLRLRHRTSMPQVWRSNQMEQVQLMFFSSLDSN